MHRYNNIKVDSMIFKNISYIISWEMLRCFMKQKGVLIQFQILYAESSKDQSN
jgi:hypothetical protein